VNRFATLLATPAVALQRFDHPPGLEHHDPEVEVAPCDSINFVEAGTFTVRVGRARWRFASGAIFLARRDLAFTCAHDCAAPDDRCLSLAFDAQTVEDLRAVGLAELPGPAQEASARQAFLYRRLGACGPGSEVALELLAGALYESFAPGVSPPRALPRVAHLLAALERALDLIDADWASALSLHDLARAAALSPYHFARVFRELVGVPPHRYLAAVRLRHAARMLDEGASVTEACFDCGFGSLSHFIRAFRDRYGAAPSTLRRSGVRRAWKTALAVPADPRRRRRAER